MARRTPHIQHDTLTCGESRIAVGGREWWEWLDEEGTTTFHFVGNTGNFTARRERKSRGLYWYAYRKQGGKLRKAYLGKSEELTAGRLNAAASELCHAAELEPLVSAKVERQRSYRTQLLDTKLSIPASRSGRVERTRLLTRLQEAAGYPLTLITAPAGFGKTTLLGEWRASRASADEGDEVDATDEAFEFAWVSLDSGENDPIRFWSYCIAALAGAAEEFARVGEQALAMLRSPHPDALEMVRTALVNSAAHLPRHVMLVLDDYHLIHAQVVHDGLTSLLDYLPPRLHIVLACRTEPPLPLARLRGRGQVLELHAADLRFTLDETAAFLNQVMGLSLSTEHITALEEHTEGWIAGLQLAALSLQEHGDVARFVTHFNGNHRYIMEYLVQEVLQQQSEPVQEFLLRTSLLERLSSPLCDAVTGNTNGAAMLERLERDNLFLFSLDEERQWYRYHHLFASALREHLQQVQPKMVPLLHQRAAAWYEAGGFLADAINHAFQMHDELAAGLLIERHMQELFQRGEVMTIKSWLERLPDRVKQARPRLLIFLGAAFVAIGQFDEAESRLREAERAIAVLRAREEQDAELRAYCHHARSDCVAMETVMVAFQGNVSRALELYEQAMAVVPEEDVFMHSVLAASLSTAYMLNGKIIEAAQALAAAKHASQAAGNTHVILASIAAQAYFFMEQGHLHQAAQVYRQAIEVAAQPDGQLFPAASIACVGLGEVLYQWNELAEADRIFEQGIALGELWGYVMLHARGYVIWARVKYALGDIAGAQEVLRRLEQQALRYNIPQALIWAGATRARLAVFQSDTGFATRWLQGAGLNRDEQVTYLNEYEYITMARVLIAQGNADAAIRLLERLLAVAEDEGRDRSVIEMLTLIALAQVARGDTVPALNALARALSLAAPEAFIHTFTDEGAAMVSLLMKLVAAHKQGTLSPTWPVSLSYVGKLLELLGVCIILPQEIRQSAYAVAQSLVDPLSERELTILRLLAAGLSNQEIAHEMVVAVSTIKWHLKHIYAKLQAHSRTQVMRKARELQLLP